MGVLVGVILIHISSATQANCHGGGGY